VVSQKKNIRRLRKDGPSDHDRLIRENFTVSELKSRLNMGLIEAKQRDPKTWEAFLKRGKALLALEKVLVQVR
jgi:hypothetical protein